MSIQPKNKRGAFNILFFLFLINVLAWIAVYDLSQPKFLKVVFFDIGQGDSVFIETPSSQQILVDGGPDSLVLKKLAATMPFWDRTIDLIILSHPEADHMLGLNEVLKHYQVRNILWTGVIKDTSQCREWLELIGDEGARVFIAQAGEKIITPKVIIKILFPFKKLEGREMKNVNDTSIVAELIFGKNSFLFTGDISKSIEDQIIERGVGAKADVLKVAHHGSKTSSSRKFVKEVSPQWAVISAGRNNRYGHPHFETLKTLSDFGIKILRTDEMGNITFVSDGENLKIANEY